MHAHERSPRTSTLWPPLEVRQVSDTYLSIVDEAAPGLVEGLYLHGSLGFGEWYAGRSDIDFVAVTSGRVDDATVALLRDVHETLGETFPSPAFDGFYVTWDDLAASPYDCPDVPCILGGGFVDEGRVDVNPVTWHELARHGETLRGPRLDDVDIWTDQQALRDYTHRNLSAYWAGQADALRRFPAEAAKPDIVAWLVLGVSRLHHLLATDRLTSKDGAGQHAVDVFGESWRPLVVEAMAYRATGERAGLLPDEELGAQVIAFAEMSVREGLALRP